MRLTLHITALAVFASTSAAQIRTTGAIALTGGTLVNPLVAPVPNAVVVVRDGRIECAGPRSTCRVPVGATRMDVTGAYVSPGLIDAHVHYSQTGWVDGRPDTYDLRSELPYDSIVGALSIDQSPFNRAYLCSGITAVYDVGGYPWTYMVARRQESMTDAPHVASAGPLLTTINHWVNTGTIRQFEWMQNDSVVRAVVRANKYLGAAAIKVWYIQRPDSLMPAARALLDVTGAEARRVGLPLIVHATQLARAKEALRAGATLLVHSVAPDSIDDEFISLAKANGAIVTPTLTVLEGYADVAAGRSPRARYPLECVDAVTRAKLERRLPYAEVRTHATEQRNRDVFAATVRNIQRMKAAGIPMAVGTDAGNPGTAHGPSIYREMEAMQGAGMSATEVFASATIVAARAMHRDRDIGSLEAQKIADIVVFDADPTRDIANARRVRLVMRAGVPHRKTDLLPKGR